MTSCRPGDPPLDRHPAPRPHAPSTVQGNQRRRDAADLLTAISYFLGGSPAEPSLVVLGYRGQRVVTSNLLHLPALTKPPADNLTGVWAMVRGHLAVHHANAVSIIAYADRYWTSPVQRFADTSTRTVLNVLRVHNERWWALDCPDPATCPQPECTPLGTKLLLHRENLTHENADA